MFLAVCIFSRCADLLSFADQAPLQPWLSYFGVIFLGLVVIFNGFEVFLTDSWSTSDFISAYVSLRFLGSRASPSTS